MFCWFIGGAAPLRAAEPGVMEKARAEGELVLYTAWGLDTVQALQKAFAKNIPSSRSMYCALAASGY